MKYLLHKMNDFLYDVLGVLLPTSNEIKLVSDIIFLFNFKFKSNQLM